MVARTSLARLSIAGLLVAVIVLSACTTTTVVIGGPDVDVAAPNTIDSSDDDPAQGSIDQAAPLFELQGELPLSTRDVNALIEFIEQDTGRPFLRPPVIVAQTTEDFVAGLSVEVSAFEEDADISVRSMQSLGLTTQGVAEVSQAFTDLLVSPDGILGYYDPETDELYVPIDALANDDFRSLLVHELAHALDGQHSDLTRLGQLVDEAEVSGNYEPLVALQAVAEGRASSVQNRWVRANDVTPTAPDDLEAIEAVPPVMVLSLGMAYIFGEQYIEANGGAAGSWDLLETPPLASEEFIVIGGVPRGQTIVDVPAPAADGPVLDQAVFGAIDIFTWLLGESLEPDPALILPTFTAIDGWAGGTIVLWGDQTESCSRIAIAADSSDDLNEIADAVDVWVERGPGRDLVEESDLLVVTGCAPYVP